MFNCLNYSVVERKNPKCPDKEGKFYAQFQSRGVLESKELIEKIDRNCFVGKRRETGYSGGTDDSGRCGGRSSMRRIYSENR